MLFTITDMWRAVAHKAFPALVGIGLGVGAPLLWCFGVVFEVAVAQKLGAVGLVTMWLVYLIDAGSK